MIFRDCPTCEGTGTAYEIKESRAEFVPGGLSEITGGLATTKTQVACPCPTCQVNGEPTGRVCVMSVEELADLDCALTACEIFWEAESAVKAELEHRKKLG